MLHDRWSTALYFSVDDRPLILTARFDCDLFALLDQYRRQFFPPERNFLQAHVTLFHHLPGLELEQIRNDLELAEPIEPIFCSIPTLQFTGRGTHAVLQCDELRSIRNQLAHRWQNWLTPQDRQAFRPHVTIQNKVDPSKARQTFSKLSQMWEPLTGQVIGLDLWHYAGGPWELAAH